MKHTVEQPPIHRRDIQYVLDYDPMTGELKRGRYLLRRSRTDRLPGHTARNGVRSIDINVDRKRRRIEAHKLIWYYVTGEWPAYRIVFRDGDPSNLRWDNLRMPIGEDMPSTYARLLIANECIAVEKRAPSDEEMRARLRRRYSIAT